MECIASPPLNPLSFPYEFKRYAKLSEDFGSSKFHERVFEYDDAENFVFGDFVIVARRPQ